MGWSWRILKLSGIGVYIHWTFLLLLGWILLSYIMAGHGLWGALEGVVFVLAIFACVVLHEFGHALAARKFNIRTRDITLLPIGGIARLERMPEKPWQEFYVAIAGPLVNVVLAISFLSILIVSGVSPITPDVKLVGGSFIIKMFWINVILFAFNMLPAFPMDGGRILRAALASALGYAQATEIAARVGQAMAIAFGFMGLISGNFFLIFIALFVFLAATQEAALANMKSIFQGVPVRDAMYRRFVTVSPNETLASAVEAMREGYTHDFVVAEGDRLVGVLNRQDVLKALAAGVRNALVREFMKSDCPVIHDYEMLDATFAILQSAECSSLVVVAGHHPVGLISSDSIAQWSMLQAAQRKYRELSRISDIDRARGFEPHPPPDPQERDSITRV